jgi:anaerobic selenocysteine-containing dehydrogenase
MTEAGDPTRDIGRIREIWGDRTPHGPEESWPTRVDEHVVDGIAPGDITWTRSACVLCSNGCGLDIGVSAGRIVGVRGHADDHVNHGRLGPKGLFGWQANQSRDRLTTALIRENGTLRPASWDEAMGLVVQRSREVLGQHGPLAMGFYNTGQLFVEDYYTLAVMVRGGIGTPHLDGNTRLCTATSDAALKETFGTDGDPGTLEDFDVCDTIFAVGHNMPETHTVMWMRVLDRLRGPRPPRIVVVDPRPTRIATEAEVHLRVLPGTNVALLNSIERELIELGAVDRDFVDANTIGFERLAETVAEYTPERAAEICGVDADDIRAAARVIAESERLVSTCLQGVYQSHQATAAACQVNNINLLRGMIGKPGCTVLQLNGQPTAQNTRETGADGDFTAMRNWQNPDHVAELAALWRVEQSQIPAWAPPTHIMQMMRYAETGSIRFFWIIGTNPAVSLPELWRVRSILSQEQLFVVVNDAFPSETAALADVVFPVAIWGEKTGTFTNHDRTVHLSEKAVDPPGQARTDHEIFADYATRLELTRRDGSPLLPWSTPEECFDAFTEATRGRPCDQTGITYDRLREGPIQWPCNDDHPDGTPRLYTDLRFHTTPEDCEDYGHDLLTGAALDQKEFSALRPDGRAILKSAPWQPAHEPPSEGYPLVFTSGRTVYHFHTRTKTGRAPELQAAAPEAWLEISPLDAEPLGIAEGDLVQVESPRGQLRLRARLSGIRQGVVFAPFHYGYWDERHDGASEDELARAANELTKTEWDPVSKQPVLKVAAVRVSRIAEGEAASPAPTETASAPVGQVVGR